MQTRIEIHYRWPLEGTQIATYLTGILHDDGSVKVQSTLRTTDPIWSGTLQQPKNWPAYLTHVEVVLLDPEDRPAMINALTTWESIGTIAAAY